MPDDVASVDPSIRGLSLSHIVLMKPEGLGLYIHRVELDHHVVYMNSCNQNTTEIHSYYRQLLFLFGTWYEY